jgi:hypothetical protein
VGDAPTCLQGLDCLELVSPIGSAGAEAAEPTIVDAHEPGEGSSATNAEPAPTEDSPCVELIGAAESVTTAEPEALEAWADDEARYGLHVAKGKQAVKALPPPGDTSAHAHGRDKAQRPGTTMARRGNATEAEGPGHMQA